jgi:hypothetical protein
VEILQKFALWALSLVYMFDLRPRLNWPPTFANEIAADTMNPPNSGYASLTTLLYIWTFPSLNLLTCDIFYETSKPQTPFNFDPL